MKQTWARVGLILMAAAFVAAALVAVGAADLTWGDTVAIHWSLDGEANGTAPMWLLGVFVLAAVAGLVVVALGRRPRAAGTATMLAGLAAFLAALYAGALVLTAAANSGVDDPNEVPGPSGWAILALVVVAAAFGGIAAWLATALPARPDATLDVPVLDLPATSVAAWSRSLTARWALLLSAALIVAGAVLVPLVHAWLGAILMFAGAVSSLFSRIEVFADRRGLTVHYGLVSWPRTRIPIERIEAAAPIDVSPAKWGGWGYRGSVTLFRRAAVVLRGGPGIHLTLTGGKVFVVTVDDPGTACAVLLRERAGATSASAPA